MDLGRNDPCHCGSGKKYKKCCEDKDAAALREDKKEAAGMSDACTAIMASPFTATSSGLPVAGLGAEASWCKVSLKAAQLLIVVAGVVKSAWPVSSKLTAFVTFGPPFWKNTIELRATLSRFIVDQLK